ncbi:unnamed protein product, partial [Discosporangium mesarthrocarpum]
GKGKGKAQVQDTGRVSSMRQGLGRGRGGGGVLQGTTTDRGSPGAWEALLGSTFHTRYSSNNTMLLSGLPCGDGSDGDDVPGDVATGAGDGGEGPAPVTQRLAPSWSPAFRLETSRESFLPETGAVMDALHLVLEDLKTSSLSVAHVPPLASLLLSLARLCPGEGMADFADHYARDAGDQDVAMMLPHHPPSTSALPTSPSSSWTAPLLPPQGLTERPTRFAKV